MRCHSVGVVRIRAPSIRFPNVLFVDARQSLHGRTPHDPARHPRSLSAGDLHLGGCARLSKDAGSLIPVPQTQSAFAANPLPVAMAYFDFRIADTSRSRRRHPRNVARLGPRCAWYGAAFPESLAAPKSFTAQEWPSLLGDHFCLLAVVPNKSLNLRFESVNQD